MSAERSRPSSRSCCRRYCWCLDSSSAGCCWLHTASHSRRPRQILLVWRLVEILLWQRLASPSSVIRSRCSAPGAGHCTVSRCGRSRHGACSPRSPSRLRGVRRAASTNRSVYERPLDRGVRVRGAGPRSSLAGGRGPPRSAAPSRGRRRRRRARRCRRRCRVGRRRTLRARRRARRGRAGTAQLMHRGYGHRRSSRDSQRANAHRQHPDEIACWPMEIEERRRRWKGRKRVEG